MNLDQTYLAVPAHKTKSETLKTDKINVDLRIQRDFKQAYADQIAANWQPWTCDPLHISRRRAGRHGHKKTEDVVADGMHRFDAGKQNDVLEWENCIVHEGLTLEQEAALHMWLQGHRKPDTSLDKWRLKVRAGSQAHIAMEKYLAEIGLTLSQSGGSPNSISAVGALDQMVEKYGAEVVAQGLKAIDVAFRRTDKHLWDALIIKGFVGLIGRWPEVASPTALGRKVGKKYTSHQLIAAVNAMLVYTSGGKTGARASTCAALLAEAWNARRVNPSTMYPIKARPVVPGIEDEVEDDEDD